MHLKVPPPLVLFVAAVITYAAASWLPGLTISFPGQVMLAAIVFGLGLVPDMIALLAFMRRRTTVNPMAPQNTSALVTDGIYRISRNPMYLGLLFLLIAISLFFGTLLSLLIVPGFVWYLTKFQIRPEEEQLEMLFGEAYQDYRNKVRRWI
ncbi:isoprenylcysteine carboxylmethyltransferase family protein [Roseibium sp. MMSF_3544]|uniref:methyltransferase family protein n=1 Tax=unclassified Roseibium TaxID=2629323 RepID=UPI00273DA6F7|nr:isoprenylcysteine carboxylmethyltransferase family protein [Roseibium sp. MMSF_3544]